MSRNNEIGNTGEAFIVDRLLARGIEVIGTNKRFGKAEVDIVFKDGEKFVFGEVKTRKSGGMDDGRIAITDQKMEQYKNAAETFLEEMEGEPEMRFDVFLVEYSNDRVIGFEQIKDAF